MSTRRIHHQKRGHVQAATTVAGWGRGLTWNLGAGWRGEGAKSAVVIPEATPLKGAVQMGFQYGCGVIVRNDGTCQTWGQNNGSNIPWATGPEGLWTGFWEYRAPVELSFVEEAESLLPQQLAYLKGELGPVVTAAQLEAKERKFEIAERTAEDGEKACYGQIVYEKDNIVTNPKVVAGKLITTWIALQKNVAVEPGTDPLTWIPKTPEVQMFEKTFNPGTEDEYTKTLTFTYNLTMPVKCPQMVAVKEVSMRGNHGIFLGTDGRVGMWGHGTRYGTFGQNCNAGYGPKTPVGPYDRAKKQAPTRAKPFRGTLTSGSPVITKLENVQENHSQASGQLGYSQAKKEGNLVVPFDESEPLPLSSKAEVLKGDGRELGTKAGPYATTAQTKAGEFTVSMTGSKAKGFETGEQAMFIVGAPTTVSNDEPQVAILNEFSYWIVNATTNSFQLAYFEGGEAIKAGQNLEAGSTVALVEMQSKAQAEAKEAVTNPFTPAKAKLLSITLKENASANYTGKMRSKKKAKEQLAWPLGEGAAKAAGWPIRPKPPEGVKCTQVVTSASPSGGSVALALTESKKVLAWGASNQGQVGQGGTKFGLEQFFIVPQYVVKTTGAGELENIVWIGSGEESCYAINTSGEAFIWGNLQNGLGQGREEGGKVLKHTTKPEKITGLPTGAGKRPMKVKGTRSAAFVLMEDGIVYSWGNNDKAELGNGVTGGESSTPTEIPGLTKVTEIVCGRYHAGAIKDNGGLYLWGSNEAGEQGNGEAKKPKIPSPGSGQPVNKPTQVNLEGKACLAAAMGEYNTFAVLEGTTPVKNRIHVGLRREKSFEGEQVASLKVRWESSLKTGWKFKSKLQADWWEISRLETEIEAIEVEQEENTAEEPEAQEELELLEEELDELTNPASSPDEPVSPTEVAANVWEYLWKPPEGARLTPNKGYSVKLANTSSSWIQATMETRSLWASPYA